MFIYKTAKFAPVWTTTLKIRSILVHQTLTEYAICPKMKANFWEGRNESDWSIFPY